MANAEIEAGICGFKTSVETKKKANYQVEIRLESECPHIQELGKELTEVDALQEISFRKRTPQIIELGQKHCSHASCPVPGGIIKAVEVAAGLALPKDVRISINK